MTIRDEETPKAGHCHFAVRGALLDPSTAQEVSKKVFEEVNATYSRMKEALLDEEYDMTQEEADEFAEEALAFYRTGKTRKLP